MASMKRHWLDRGRLILYPSVVALFFVSFVIYALVHAEIGMNMAGNPLGFDFVQFWSVSHVGLHEHPALAYNMAHLTAVEKGVAPGLQGFLPWRYPPMFYLVVLPFSLFPMRLALACFVAVTLALYVWAFCVVVRSGRAEPNQAPIPRALLCLSAFGPAWFNLMGGQTGFLTAALAVGALLCLERRPILAGVLIGLLCIKPHLAVLFPLCLIAVRAWRAFFAAAATVIVFAFVSTMVLGVDTLGAFLSGLHEAGQLLQAGRSPLTKMPSVFVSLRMLHVPPAAAYVVHGVVALVAAWAVWRVWRCCGDARLRNAALMTGSFFISPYIFDYDMAWLAFPVAWLTLYCMEAGWRRFERELLVLFWADTLFIAVVAQHTVTHTVPLVLAALLWMIYRRAAESPRLPDFASENHRI
jgi:hypothetical protein